MFFESILERYVSSNALNFKDEELMKVLFNPKMMTPEKFKELLKTNVLVAPRNSNEIYAIKQETLEARKINDITNEPGLNIETYRVHPLDFSIMSDEVIQCADDLDILTGINDSIIVRTPIPSLRSKY